MSGIKMKFLVFPLFLLISLSAFSAEYEIVELKEPEITYGSKCTDENKIEIEGVYYRIENRDKFRNGRKILGWHIVEFVPQPKPIKYSLRVNWRNVNGNGRKTWNDKLSESDARNGVASAYVTIPGRYEYLRKLKNGKCHSKVSVRFRLRKI